MPITAAVPSLIGAGASIYGANKAAKASSKAAEQALALQREQYQQARTDMQPYMQAGQAGLNAFQDRLLGGGGSASDPGAFGATANPTYAQAAYQAPAAFNYGADDYTQSPGYQWQLQQGMNAINSSQAHRGAMDSGATLKSLARYAQGLALQDFNAQRDYAAGRYDKDREFGRSVYDTDASRARSIYESDRGYLTDRYDTQTQNLTGLAGMGLNAASGLVGAGMNVANQGGAGLVNAGKTTGSAWMAGADAIGQGATAVGDAYTKWKAKQTPKTTLV
jgi:hypothetical protein